MGKIHFATVFAFLFIALFISTPKILLFYDAPEYIKIVSNNGFWRAITSGHTPIHPVFLGILWLVARILRFIFSVSWEYAGNLTAYFFSFISAGLFYTLADHILKSRLQKALASIIFFFLPAVWIIHTNLFVESVTLPFFLLSTLLLFNYINKLKVKDGFLYSFSIMLMLGTHIESLFWIPAILGLSFIVKSSFSRKVVFSTLLYSFLGVVFALLLYSVVFIFSKAELIPSLKNMFFAHSGGAYDTTSLTGFLRMGRNIYLNIVKGYSTLLLPLIVYLIFVDSKRYLSVAGWGFIIAAIIVEGAIWTGDFMPRRLAFFGAISAILIVRRLKLKAVIFLLYLSLITLANALLYSQPQRMMPVDQIKKVTEALPKNEIYVQSHYLEPFISDYGGKIVFVEKTSFTEIETHLASGKRVFIDSQGVKAPYFLFVGNNYHITSLGKVGDSPAKEIINNLTLCPHNRTGDLGLHIYEIKAKNYKCNLYNLIKKGVTGSSIIYYSSTLEDRIERERLDYGDLAVWLWYLLLNKKDPIGWIYVDNNGNYISIYEDNIDIDIAQ